jgi:uncharacterized membrane protein
MTEFKKGIFVTIKQQLVGTSVGRAVIYTLGHIVIAMTCNNLITGAPLKLAAIDALVEPMINGVWYYLLDKLWASKMLTKSI